MGAPIYVEIYEVLVLYKHLNMAQVEKRNRLRQSGVKGKAMCKQYMKLLL